MRYFVRLKLSYMEADFEFPDLDQAALFAEKAAKNHIKGEYNLKVSILITTPEEMDVEVKHDGDN